ncbi:hypothetical protein D9615_008372 [Tricholomella constricta]|uniref:Transcription activator GCR1-like domain-containing protein n=1 Tax=Tricholomella constricta TaxID=117010 RepID=A0A8H5HDG7_9AGAR|nr:hypothetical protein D9615_008372 [Tricholomella constricta]
MSPPPPPLSTPLIANPVLPILPTPSPIPSLSTTAWFELGKKYPKARLRAHKWDWISSSGTWLPHYEFQTIAKITHIWDGLNGHLPMRELNITWGARWKRNLRRTKTEASRRSKVVNLVDKLAAKHR